MLTYSRTRYHFPQKILRVHADLFQSKITLLISYPTCILTWIIITSFLSRPYDQQLTIGDCYEIWLRIMWALKDTYTRIKTQWKYWVPFSVIDGSENCLKHQNKVKELSTPIF